MTKPLAFVALPGGASHVATIAGAAEALDERVDVIGWAGVSAGFLVAALAAFGELHQMRHLLEKMLQKNRVLDIRPDGKLGICAWEVIPALVDEIVGADARLSDAKVPLCGVVTSADTCSPMYLSSWATPNVLVRELARATSAIHPLAPFVPIPSLGTERSPDIRLFIDGGFTDNLPDHVFDARPSAPTISVSLKAPDNLVRVREGDHIGQAVAVVGAVTFAQGRRKTRRSDGVVVDVDANGSGLDFDLSLEEIRHRVASGRLGVLRSPALQAFAP
jgi:predicted acylesterase/phospholipase RssA